MSSVIVRHISEWFIKPEHEVEGSNQPYHLGAWDLAMLSTHYIQKGLLFKKPYLLSVDQDDQFFSTSIFLESLKDSLSRTLVHFYPLAGQLVTEVDEDQHQCVIFVDCNKGPGARFIHASLDLTVYDILSPTDVPLVVQSFFDHDRAVGYDGHTRPLLSVQVTELLDGFFIGCSMNHVLGDGTSYWHFWNTWSQLHRTNTNSVSHSPIHKRWCLNGYSLPIPLPFTQPDEFVKRFKAPKLRERIFHFSYENIAKLKARANQEGNTNMISSFQALSALVWRSIVRVKKYRSDEITTCRLAACDRHRLHPPLPREYFGNALSALSTTTTAGELLKHNLGWAALLLHKSVANHTDKTVRDFVKGWMKTPFVYQFRQLSDSSSLHMGSSPRFDMYGNEFGVGKPIAVRSGSANKFDGKVTAYPGYEGGGSIDLEICLLPDSMRALETDKEFMDAVSLSWNGYIVNNGL